MNKNVSQTQGKMLNFTLLVIIRIALALRYMHKNIQSHIANSKVIKKKIQTFPENRMDKLWCIYVREYYIAVKMNKIRSDHRV